MGQKDICHILSNKHTVYELKHQHVARYHINQKCAEQLLPREGTELQFEKYTLDFFQHIPSVYMKCNKEY